MYTIYIFHVHVSTEASGGSIEQISENAPKHSQRNSNCKMQFRKQKPCVKGKASIYMKKYTQSKQRLCQKYEEIFITEENLHQRVQT